MRPAFSRIILPFALCAAACLFAAGCATKAPPSPQPELAPAESPAPAPKAAEPAQAQPQSVEVEPSAIGVDAQGFWPAPESRSKSVAISLLVGNAKSLRSWKVEILPEGGRGGAVKTFSGKPAELPSALSWDGQGEGGMIAAEGRYSALLSASYSDSRLPPVSRSSKAFALSLSGPEPLLVADPQRLEPTGSGLKAPVSFAIAGNSEFSRITSWRLDIVAADGKVFRSFKGDWPALGAASGAPAAILWDGRSEAGELVRPGRRYSAILSLADEYGHSTSTQLSVPVAELPYAPERSSVQPWSAGFSPNGDNVMDAMDFSLGFGQRASVRSWRLDIAHEGKGLVRSFRGSAPELPASLSWDGKTGSGEAAPEGRYTATLSVDYGSDFSPALARSPSFVLELAPPRLELSRSPELFSPDASLAGEARSADEGAMILGLEAKPSLGRLTDWSVEVIDPGEQVFMRFDGLWPASGPFQEIAWNGVGSDGALVESAETYRLVARVRDEYGNSSEARGSFDTDILVIKDGDRYRVDVASIVFKGYTDDYEHVPEAQAAQNRLTLDRLAAKFAKFPGYRIRLVGHAVMINWDDPNLGIPEQEKVLVPLSRARAAAIAKALAARGIEASRMSIEGVGANRQVVPDSDLANRWKNRRVEFYLERP